MNDDLNADARRLVDLAREGRTPGEHDKLRIAQRLAGPLAAGVAAGTAAGLAKTAASGEAAAAAGTKVAVGSKLLGSMGFKVIALAVVGAVGTAVVVNQVDSRSDVPVATQSAPAEPPAVQRSSPRIEATEQAVEPTVPPQPRESEPPASPVPVMHKPASARSAAPAHELAQEAALLHQAQTALRAGDSAKALELANQHAQQFPHSQLGNERDVLRVLSLCKLGQVQAAKQIGARLLQKAKDSPWYPQVAESCAAQ